MDKITIELENRNTEDVKVSTGTESVIIPTAPETDAKASKEPERKTQKKKRKLPRYSDSQWKEIFSDWENSEDTCFFRDFCNARNIVEGTFRRKYSAINKETFRSFKKREYNSQNEKQNIPVPPQCSVVEPTESYVAPAAASPVQQAISEPATIENMLNRIIVRNKDMTIVLPMGASIEQFDIAINRVCG